MLSRLNRRFYNSLTFRLIVSYTLVFVISSLILFGIIFYKLTEYTVDELDKRMRDQLQELASTTETQDIAQIAENVKIEAATSRYNRRFFRIYDLNFKELVSTKRDPWDLMDCDLNKFRSLPADEVTFETIRVPGHRRKGRVLYAKLGKKWYLQMGYSMDKEDRQRKKIRVFFTQLLMYVFVPFSIIIGWLMARQATKDIRSMTQIVSGIRDGDLSLRMPELQASSDLQKLASAFNEMLEKLQHLLREQRHVADNIAHDLRSPLTRICSEIEVTLLSQRDTDEYEATLRSITNEIQQLQGMINILLDIASMEANVIDSRKRMQIRPLLEEVTDIFEFVMEDKEIKLELDCPNDLTALISRDYLKMALANLIDNAIKYTSAGGTVRIHGQANELLLELIIEDTGVGIPPDNLPNIFDRFYRGEASRTTTGNGLGLSLVKSVINAHGGEIQVRSELGAGTTFRIILPN